MTKEHLGTKYKEYDDLFKYLDRKCNFHNTRKNDPTSTTWTCHNDLRFTEAWCKRNKIDFTIVKHIMGFFGGFCDCEILFNVAIEEHEKIFQRHLMITEDLRK